MPVGIVTKRIAAVLNVMETTTTMSYAHPVAWLAALVTLTGCGLQPGKPCTAVAARVGVGVQVEPPLADRVNYATLRMCWDGSCQTLTMALDRVTQADSQGCSGTDPDDVCHARAVPTGSLAGFADMSKLPKKPVQVTVVLRGTSEDQVFDQRITVTPKGVFPNGPDCGEGGPQAHLLVVGGRLHERS